MKHTTTMKTAPIANLHKDAILAAVQAARSSLRIDAAPTHPGLDKAAGARRRPRVAKATAAIATLDWANDLIRLDQHDSTLALRLSEAVVAMRDLAPNGNVHLKVVADRLHLAAMLLFSARRERDLDGRLRAILPDVYGIEAMVSDAPADRAGDIMINAQRIARLARA